MTECDNLIERLHDDACNHVHLAVVAEAIPVAEMHIDLALFSAEQAQLVELLCGDGAIND